MKATTDMQLTIDLTSALTGLFAMSSSVISQESACAMGAYAAAHVLDGRVSPCAPVVVTNCTESGTVAVSDKRRASNATSKPVNFTVKTWPLRPSGICGAPPG